MDWFTFLLAVCLTLAWIKSEHDKRVPPEDMWGQGDE